MTAMSLLVALRPAELDVLPRKSLKLHAFYHQCVASGLLSFIFVRAGLAVWVLASSACLLPQETQILNPVPPVQNRPPRIIEEQALLNGSGDRIVYTGNGTGCSLDFSLKLSDPDLNDVLLVNWYAYQMSQSGLPIWLQEFIQPDVPGNEIRNTSANWNVSSLTTPPFSQEGTYVVEVLVSDGSLDANRRPQPRPDGTTTYVDSYAWTVVLQTGTCSP